MVSTDSLRFEIDLPRKVMSGETVPITLRVRNAGADTLELCLRGRTITFDVDVTRGDGRAVWRRLEGQVIPAILQIRQLAPGESLVLNADWDQRGNDGDVVPPGSYTVEGTLLTDGVDPLRTAPAPLQIVPLES